MKINTYKESSNFNNSINNNLSIKDRIKTLTLSLFKKNRVDETFEKKFKEKLTISDRMNNHSLLKTTAKLHKRFPQDRKISNTYKKLIKERDQLLNKASKSIRTKEQAHKALEIINNRIERIGRASEEQMIDYPDDIDNILKEANSMKALLYSIRDKIEMKHFSPVNMSSPTLRFNFKPRVHIYPADDTNKIVKKPKMNSNSMMMDLQSDYIRDDQKVSTKL